MVWTYTRGLAGVQDILFGDSTTTQNQSRKGLTGTNTRAIQYIDDAVIPVSTATKTLLSLGATSYIDDAFAAVAAGTGIAKANLAVYGLTRSSVTTATPQALDVSDPVYGYIPSSAQKTALGLVTTQSVSLPHTASAANGYTTENQIRDMNASEYGTGKDGAFATGAVTDPATAPSGLSTSTTGGAMAAATYSYKVTFGNATGETLPSSASSTQVTTGAASTISMTIPVGGSNTAWRRIYRDNGASSWKLVGYVPDNTTTTFTDGLMTPSSTTAPGSNTTGATWTTPSGELHFDGDATLPAFTMGGHLTIRCRGTLTINGAITGAAITSNSPLTAKGQTIIGATNISFTHSEQGFGTNYVAFWVPGRGTDGYVVAGSAGVGGNAGAVLRIYAHNIKIKANVTLTGAAGTAASGNNSTGGGGGAGGIFFAKARDAITDDGTACTINVSGGAGGNASGATGGFTVRGGTGGGGGLIFLDAPVLSVASVTQTKNAGAAGSDSSSGATINNYVSGVGGSSSGRGGYTSSINGAHVAATAGQSVASTDHGPRFFR